MEKIKEFISKNKINILFLVSAILFGFIFAFIEIVADDATNINLIGGTIKEQIKFNLATYQNWTSRILVNTVWSIALGKGPAGFAAFMGLSEFFLLKGLYSLFGRKESVTDAVFVILLTMLLPFRFLNTAGWVATMGTYFSTNAFAVYGLVPMKKVYNGEGFHPIEFILYALALIYAGNFEQTCMMLLFLYGVFFVYSIFAKKIRWESFVYLGINVASLIFILTCPGNWGRKADEYALFPTYRMLGFVDKVELATTLSLKWIFIDAIPVILLTMGLIAFVAMKKRGVGLQSFIASVPFILLVALGPLKEVVYPLFPTFTRLNETINQYGAINPEQQGSGLGAFQLYIYLILTLCMLAGLILVNDKVESFVCDLALSVIGVGTGVMMGFSPSIYASGERTFATLTICIMLICAHVYALNRDAIVTEKNHSRLRFVMMTVITISYMNLAVLVLTFST